MDLTRRRLLGGAAAGIGLAAAGFRVRAMTLGGWEVTTLSDGHLMLPADFIFGAIPEAEAAPIRAEFGLTGATLTPPCNVTLLRTPDALVLFDCGAGHGFQSTAGKLPEALAAAGVAPEEVTHVVFTHAHPDHLWGILDEFDDPVFPDAAHLMGRAERDYWMDPATAGTIGADRATFAAGALRRLEAMADRMAVFGDGEEILPGVAARASYGHTPGHMSFELRNGTEAAMVLGDAISNPHIAFLHPDWPSGADQDAAAAAATRAGLLDQLAAAQMPVIGFHLPADGMGRVERKDGAYRFVPLAG